MAKKSKKIEDETKKVVAKCDNPNEVVANCDHPEEVIANCENPQETALSQYDIEKLIVTVRGEQVLIDQDIARIYGVTTGRLNQQAKRNIERFPESFRFQLTKEERDGVIANCDNLRSLKFYPSLPYAYTEQGIGQLSTVVHSKIAIERSIMIMNAFVAMRRFMVQNAGILMRIAHLEKHQIETDQKMDMLLDRMDKRADNVEATIHSRYYESFQTDLKKHNEQYLEIKFVQLPHRNHDRFLIIDDDVYLLGASVKDMGVGMCAVTKMQVSPETILGLLICELFRQILYVNGLSSYIRSKQLAQWVLPRSGDQVEGGRTRGV